MLETDWIKVGAAGKAIDGRVITPEMLESAGRTYSSSLYNAQISSDHFVFPGLGQVTQVKAENDAEGRMALWAKLNPTAEFLARNQSKRQLFFSMELRPNFPEKGDWYLTGLAITDQPASQGLSPTHFKAGEDGRERFFYTAGIKAIEGGRWTEQEVPKVELNPAKPETTPPPPGEEAPGWAKNFLASIKSLLTANGDPETQPEDSPMTAEEKTSFDALQKRVGELSTLPEQVTKLTKAVSGLAEQFKAGAGDPKPEGKDADKVEFAAAIENLKKELGDKFTEFEKFMGETRETEALEVTAPSAGQDDDASKWV